MLKSNEELTDQADQMDTQEIVQDVLNWRNLKSKRQKRQKFKDYQEELLREIPGAASRTNAAMHAVIDVTAEGCEDQNSGMGATSEIRNQALIHYVARLASSNSDSDEFDFSFVESLLESGADINTADKYGQTMFHEVARSWNVDVARFLLSKGANINQQDKYGRAPLHVAAAVDYTEMIEFLLGNHADIRITTFGELQMPIHFAAKNDACQALKLLINYGATIHCRDYHNRTPLQVAASMSRSKAARFLVELGAPSGVYDHNGEMTLSLLIVKMPEVAILALDQFRSQDMINRKEYHFLNYIEGTRIYDKDPRENKARSPLEVATQQQQYGILMHPVMKRLIDIKWEKFGRKGARRDLIINIIFAFVWTILGITMPISADKLYSPLRNTWWRLAIAMTAICLTGWETFQQISTLIYINRAFRRWKAFREKTLQNDKRYCHPKWKDETDYLEKEIKAAHEEKLFWQQDSWIFVDWMALMLIIAGLTSHVIFLVSDSKSSRDAHVRIVAFLLIVLWIRLLKFARPFKDPGPFVASIAPMLKDCAKWSLLFCLLFIPYAAIFWMIFGQADSDPAESAFDIPGLLFTVFTMAAFSNLAPIEEFEVIDKSMARLLASTFVAISTIITLNLLIAMLADTFTRMYENSLETATMQRAKTLLYLEQSLASDAWQKYCEHIQDECSPEVRSLSDNVSMGKRDKLRLKETLHRSVSEIHTIVSDRFAKHVGNEKSDMDKLIEGVHNLNKNIKCVLRGNGGKTDNPNVLNLNITLEKPNKRKRTMSSPTLGKVSGKKNRKMRIDVAESLKNTNEKGWKTDKNETDNNKDTQAYLQTLSVSSDSSSHETESKIMNNIRGELNKVLALVEQAIQKGNVNVSLNGETAFNESPGMNTIDQSDSLDNGEESGDEQSTAVSEKGWAHYETDVDGDDNIHETINPMWSLKSNMIGSRRQSSPGVSDDARACNDTQSQALFLEHSKLRADSSETDNDTERHEESSFLSSSSDGNITCDDNLIYEDRLDGINATAKKIMAEVQYSTDPAPLEDHVSPSEDSDSHNNGSESDTSSQRTSSDSSSYQHNEATGYDHVCSSLASDASNQYLSDNAMSTQATDVTSDESLVSLPTETEQDSSKTTHVRWADDVEDCDIPFLDVRQISRSSSENFSIDQHMEDRPIQSCENST